MNEPNQDEQWRYIACDHIGVSYEGVKLEERTNCDGTKYWYAEQPIGTLFGSEVDGACSGIGRTKEEALERLAEDKRKLQESLWF